MGEMKAFFDETSDGHLFMFAGWLADWNEWIKFSEAWDAELKFAPSIDYFKHNEAMGLKDEFQGWSENTRDDKLRALRHVIEKHSLTGLVTRLSVSEIDALFKNSIVPRRELRRHIRFTEPYHVAAQCAIGMTLGYQLVVANNPNDRVDFVFDEGVKYLSDIITNYPKLKQALDPQAAAIGGTIASGNDRKIVALQAADMLAGQELAYVKSGADIPDKSQIGLSHVRRFPCPTEVLSTVPVSISKFNIAWSTRMLERAARKGRDGKTEK